MTDTWRFEQIGLGVSRCPTDIDQDYSLMEEARKERQAHPLYVVMPVDDGWRVDAVTYDPYKD